MYYVWNQLIHYFYKKTMLNGKIRKDIKVIKKLRFIGKELAKLFLSIFFNLSLLILENNLQIIPFMQAS